MKILLEVLKKAMNIFDLFILAAAAYLLTSYDYSNLSVLNIVYIVVFVMWLVMFFVRIYIVYKKNGGKK